MQNPQAMTYDQYKDLFDKILEDPNPQEPYTKESYLNYVKLGKTRMNRWDKQFEPDQKLKELLKRIDQPQHWIIITEPWCGDAAHAVPFLIKMAAENELITYEIQLRDSEPFLIEDYLTNRAKSIPKLIARDSAGNDLFTWGPRPKPAQKMYDDMRANEADGESLKITLQNWFNRDKGITLSGEISQLITGPKSETVDQNRG